MNPEKGIYLLLVEDNPGDIRLIQEMLKGTVEVKMDAVNHLSSAIDHINSKETDVVLLDLGLPDSQGLNTVSQVAANRPLLPIIVITSQDDDLLALEALKLGAQDYLVKGKIDPDTLIRSVRYAMERKKAEEALKESEEKYRRVAENVNDLIFTVDKDWNFTFVSERIGNFDYKKEEVIGRHIAEFLSPASQKIALEHFAKALSGEEKYSFFEFEFLKKDKSIILVEVSISNLSDTKGNLINRMGVARNISERKHAEEALRKSEEQYRLLTENAGETILVAQDGMIKFANEMAERLTGYSLQEIISQPFINFIHPEDKEKVALNYSKRIKDEPAPNTYEFRIITQEGKTRWVEINAASTEWEDQPATLNLLTDITERKMAEETLKESEARYRAIFDNATEGIIIADVETMKTKYVNPAICRMLGYTSEELTGMSVNEIHPAKDWDYIQTEFKSQARGEKIIAADLPCLKKDGKIIYADFSTAPVIIDGRVCNIGMVTETTERKRAEEELKESEEKYRLLAENVNDLIFTNDKDWKFTFVSGRIGNFDYKMEEVIGRRIGEFLTPASQKVALEHFNKALSGEEKYSVFEIEFLKKDGSIIPLEVNITTIFDSEGKFLGRLGVARDITERKQAEEALRSERDFVENLIDTAQAIILILDPEGRIVRFNPYMEDITGVKLNEVEGNDWFKTFLPQRDQEAIRALFANAIKGIQTLGHINPVLTNDSRERQIEWYDKTLKDTNGKTTGLLAVGQDITARKQAEEALLKSKAHLSNALRIAKLGHWEYDVDKDMFTFSDEFYELFRTSAEQMGGYTMPSARYAQLFVHPDDLYMVGEETRKAIETTDPNFSRQIEHRIIYADGKPGYILVRFNVIKDSEGRTIKTFGANQDISERKLAEQALQESKERLNEAMNLGKLGYWEYDVESQKIEWSEQTYNIFERNVILGPPSAEEEAQYYSPEQAQILRGYSQSAIETGKAYEYELEAHLLSGKYLYLTSLMRPIKDKYGKVIKIFGIVQDITERKRAEEALRESQEKLSGILQAVPDYMCIIDEDYNMIWANEALINTYGPAQDKKCYEVYHKTEEPCANCLIRQVFADGKMHQHEVETVSASGEKIYQLSIASVASVYPDGRPKTVIELSRDITEHKKLEEQFRQAQKMEAVGRLAGGIAHDFNNLLTVISGNTELAMMDLKEDDPLIHDLQQVQKAAVRASKLTNQLMAFSRRQKLIAKVFDLNTLIVDMEKMLKRVIGEDIGFTINLAKDLWNVKVDSGQFEQIIMNLCVNAKYAMAEGGKLTIETNNVHLSEEYCDIHSGSKPGDYVMIAVSDNGCGMNQETKSRLFEPFYTTKPEGEGTGLGLATVFGIVKQSEGFINVYSELGHGAAFKIYLPRVKEAVDSGTVELISGDKLFGKETILLVEDEEGVRNIAVKTLRKFGYKIIEAENGGMGYLKCKNSTQPIDLIITDVIMPEMSGKEFIRNIKEFWPNIKVLFMSGYTYDAITKQGIIEADVNFISKPFDPMTFARKVREVLNK